ncbi:MAG: multifunctional CCA tRNA nucleotidyl transferase/2'3'-cyclic phosphodiesterase/2'nucleotidase/phosphatase [Thiogranum sp.]
MEIYLVGGAVRGRLLGLPVSERDWVVVGASPQDMLEQGFKQVGKDFPVFLHPETKEEYALARTERKTGHGYKGFAFHTSTDTTLEEDLRRRDLTINAMAEMPDGTLIDPYPGQQDLNAGLLRHVSPAFAEDPVRILRTARFAAQFGTWGFKVAHSTNKLMRKMVDNGEVNHLVAERVWAEFAKALATDSPQQFFTVLRGCNALAILFPEIDREYPDGSQAHSDKADIAALDAMQAGVSHDKDPRLRFSVLIQALGHDLTQEQRIRQAETLCKRLRAPNDYTQLALSAINLEQKADSDKPEDILELMESTGAFKQSGRWRLLLSVYLAAGLIDRRRADKLAEISANAASVNAAQFENQNLAGPALGSAIRTKRLEIIRNAHV